MQFHLYGDELIVGHLYIIHSGQWQLLVVKILMEAVTAHHVEQGQGRHIGFVSAVIVGALLHAMPEHQPSVDHRLQCELVRKAKVHSP